MPKMPNDFGRYENQLEDQIRAGEITRAEANNTYGTMAGAKLGGLAAIGVMSVLCPGVGSAVGIALFGAGVVGGAKMGSELSKPKR